MKQLLTILFFFLFTKTFACSCFNPPYDRLYQLADFIAVGKITYIDSTEHRDEFRNINIQIISLYKGEPITKLTIGNHLYSNCGIYTPLNSTWLIYAFKMKDGSLSFDMCSKSEHIDWYKFGKTDSAYKKIRETSIRRELKTLDVLKKMNISHTNPGNLILQLDDSAKRSLKGFKEEHESLGVFEVVFTADENLKEINIIKPFRNNSLTQNLKKQLLSAKLKFLPYEEYKKVERRYVVIFFYYTAGPNYESFVSRNLL